MQAIINRISDPLMLDHIMFPQVNINVQNWLHEQVYAPVQHLIGIGTELFNKAKVSYENLNDQMRLSNLRHALSNMNGVDDPNVIQSITNYDMICAANPATQRYIMANPWLREQYHLQRVDGYAGTYHDMQPDAVGKDHYDYRRVMDGVVTVEDGEMVANEYIEVTAVFNENPLDAIDKHNILSIWDMIASSAHTGRDPTMIR